MTTKKTRIKHAPEFKTEALKLADKVGVALSILPMIAILLLDMLKEMLISFVYLFNLNSEYVNLLRSYTQLW